MKITCFYGPFSSKPCLITGGYMKIWRKKVVLWPADSTHPTSSPSHFSRPPVPRHLWHFPFGSLCQGCCWVNVGQSTANNSKTGSRFFCRCCGLLFLGVDLVAIWVITHSSRVCLSTLRHFHFSRGSDWSHEWKPTQLCLRCFWPHGPLSTLAKRACAVMPPQ